MANWLIPLSFGSPALFLAAISSGIGIYLRKPVWLVIGSALSIPPAIYLGSTPAFHLIGYGLPVLPALSACALLKNKVRLAVILLLPLIALACYLLAIAVLQ